MNQMASPGTSLGLIACVFTLVIFSGLGLMNGKLESSNFTAIAAYLFGVLSGALGASSLRAPTRAGDAPPSTTTTSSVTDGSATVSSTVKP